MKKSIYAGLVRGINVSGHNIIKMEQLRQCCAAIGFEDVSTYVQSGNIVFKAAAAPSECAQRLQKEIENARNFTVHIAIRTAKEIAAVIKHNPYLSKKNIEPLRLHVTFFDKAPLPEALKKLEETNAAPDEFHAIGREIYLYCPNGYGNTKLSNMRIERALDRIATTRNWNTVNRLHAMCVEMAA